jgi:hypothetical protein
MCSLFKINSRNSLLSVLQKQFASAPICRKSQDEIWFKVSDTTWYRSWIANEPKTYIMMSNFG